MFPQEINIVSFALIVMYTAIFVVAFCEFYLISCTTKCPKSSTPVKHRSLILNDVHLAEVNIFLLVAYAVVSLTLLAVFGTDKANFIGDVCFAMSIGYLVGLALLFGLMILIDSCTLRDGHERLFQYISNKFRDKGGKGGNAKVEDLEKAAPLPPQDSKESVFCVRELVTCHLKEVNEVEDHEVEPELPRVPCSYNFPKRTDDSKCERVLEAC